MKGLICNDKSTEGKNPSAEFIQISKTLSNIKHKMDNNRTLTQIIFDKDTWRT